MMWPCVVLMTLLAAAAHGAHVEITATQPQGLRFAVTDAGYSLVGLHYSINKPVSGVAAADVNVDLTSGAKQGSEFVYEDSSTVLHPGDKVNYWLMTLSTATGQGENVLDQSYTFTGPTTTPRPTTTRPTTAKPTTSRPAEVTVGDGAGFKTDTPFHATAPTASPTDQQPQQPTAAPGSGSSSSGSSTSGSSSSGSSTSGGSVSGSGTCGVCGDTYDKTPTCTSYPCLIFQDDFDNLDLKLWEHEITAGGGGNWEFQYYTNNRSNSYVKDGKLFLRPTLTSERYGEEFLTKGDLNLWGSTPGDMCTGNLFWGCQRQGMPGQVVNPIQSARLRSSRHFNFQYGRLEVEAKMPTGDWLWPAIWLLPRYHAYGPWPASGEIDLVESRGNLHLTDEHGASVGVQQVGSTLHFGPFVEANQWPKAHATTNAQKGTFGDSFHKYRLDWDETSIKFFVDDAQILSVDPGPKGFWGLGEFEKSGGGHYDNPWAAGGKMAPFDQEFYIVMNLAVGGTGYFKDNLHNSPYPKPWNDHAGHAATDFWNARNNWLPTWHLDQNHGEDAALQVNYVRVWKMKPNP